MKGRRQSMIPAGTVRCELLAKGKKDEARRVCTELECQGKAPLKLGVGDVDREAVLQPVRGSHSDDDDDLEHS